MRNKAISFFSLAVVFIAVTVVFYSQGGISLAKYLIFIMGGFAAGVLFVRGVMAIKKE